MRDERGQAMVLLLALILALVLGGAMLAAVAAGLGAHQERRGIADVIALAGAEAMRNAQPRLFEPPELDHGVPNPRHLEKAGYLALARRAAAATARRNGIRRLAVTFPDASALAPTRIAIVVSDPLTVAGRRLTTPARAVAEIVPVATPTAGASLSGSYEGPFAERQGQRMRPDVALAFDRLATAAERDGHALVITSAYRSDAEQAALFAAHPDPKWVARPGTSLHRLGTELDLGPASAYAWLAANARRFGFVQRYSWEPWHYGCVLCDSASHERDLGRHRPRQPPRRTQRRHLPRRRRPSRRRPALRRPARRRSRVHAR